MLNIMVSILGFLVLLIFVLIMACVSLVFIVALVCFGSKIYSGLSGKENRLSKFWDEVFHDL